MNLRLLACVGSILAPGSRMCHVLTPPEFYHDQVHYSEVPPLAKNKGKILSKSMIET
jgi:hypothetical protein